MKKASVYIILILILAAAWEYFGSNSHTSRLLISSPSLIWSYFIENSAAMTEAVLATLVEAISGLAIATLFSFLMMIVCFYRPRLMDYILPVMLTSQVVPLIVLAPFFIILFGIGFTSKIAMATIICFFPIFVNFAQGYKAINVNIHELLYIYNTSTWNRIRHVYFPLSMPSIIAGLKISATLAVIGAIVAEFNGAETGLGKNLFLSAKRLEPDLMMTSLLLATLLGFFCFSIIYFIEMRYGKWYLGQNKKQLK